MSLFIIVLLIVVFMCLTISFVTYRVVFYAPNKVQNNIYNIPSGAQYEAQRDTMLHMIHELAAQPFEQVFTTSLDGLKLTGKYYHVSDNAPLAICFHGYRSTGIRDFSGGSKVCFSLKQNLLIVDQRAQGDSEGHTMTFGVKEKFDCVAWINYAIQRFGNNVKIILYGVSMGASTILMAAGLSLPVNACAVIADSPYTTAKEIICKVCKVDMKLPVKIVYPFIYFGAWLFGHFHLKEGDTIAAVKHTKIPILIIHGEADQFVPCEMSQRIQKACPDFIQRYTFPKAGHGISYLVDKPRYEKIISQFVAELFHYVK